MQQQPHEIDPLEQDAPRLARALRLASSEASAVVESVLPPGCTARGAGERLGVDKMLAWKLLAFARATTPVAMLQARPGRRGWETLLGAIERAGLAEARCATLRSSIEHLQSTLDDPDLGVDLSAYATARPRRAAFPDSDAARRIRSTHFATRAAAVFASRVKIMTYMVKRNRERPDRVDLTVLELLDDVERQIPGEMLPVAVCDLSDEELRQTLPAGMDPRSLPGRSGTLPPLIESVSSPGVVGNELHPMECDGDRAVGFTRRDPRRVGPLRFSFAEHMHACGSIFGDGADDEIVLAMPVQSWIEFGVLELLWHGDVPCGGPPQASGHFPNSGLPPEQWKSSPRIEAIERFDRCRTPGLPDSLRKTGVAHRRLLQIALEFAGEPYEAFEHWRYVVECPAIRSQLMMRRPMASRSPE